MKKYKLIKKTGVVVLASALVVTPVNASSLDSDKISEQEVIKHDSLWLITDMPGGRF